MEGRNNNPNPWSSSNPNPNPNTSENNPTSRGFSLQPQENNHPSMRNSGFSSLQPQENNPTSRGSSLQPQENNPNSRGFSSLPPQENNHPSMRNSGFSSLQPQENNHPPMSNSQMRNSGVSNPNVAPYPGDYYEMVSEFDQLGVSNPTHPSYTDDHINQDFRRNNGMPLSRMYYPSADYSNAGGLRGNAFNNQMQRDWLFNDYVARNSHRDDVGKYYGGYGRGYGRGDEYLTKISSRGMTNRNGSGFGRNRARLGNGMGFGQRVESLNGFRDNGLNQDQNGGSNGVYGTRQVVNFSSLDELKGKLVLVAMDQQGGRFLQSKLEQGNSEDVEMIYSELKDRIRDLMMDQFANYIIQKLFEVCNEEQITELLLSVVQDDHFLLDICIDMHGNKVMQKLIENLTNSEQISMLISVLRRITVILMKSVNGHHVIQSCFRCFPPEDKKQILNVVADNCLEIATDQCGCCVLQQCVLHAEGELRERLVAEIIANALILSEHPYGNYVVQHIVGLPIPIVTAEIVARLSGNFVFLSVNKHGSNVVEHILKECPDHVNTIILEIVNSQNLLMVVQDPYGNYVIQTALNKSRGTVHYKLMTMIQNNYAFLHSHLYGKRVLAKTRNKGSRSFRM